MSIYLKRNSKLAILFIVAGLLFIAPSFASASVIASQSVDDTASVAGNSLEQTLGTGLSGSVETISLVINDTSEFSYLRVYCYNDSAYSSACSGDNPSFWNSDFTTFTTGKQVKVFTFSSFILNPSKYYTLYVAGLSGSGVGYGSSDSNSYVNGCLLAGSSCSSGTLKDLAFSVNSPIVDTSTHFISVSPLNNSTTTQNVQFSTEWIINYDDWQKLDTFWSSPAGKIRVSAQIFDYKDSSWGMTLFGWALPIGSETSTTSRIFVFDGVTENKYLKNNRDYKMVWTLLGSNMYNFFGPEFLVEKTTYFTVGSTTNAGNVEVAALVEENIDTRVADNCNVLSGFNANECVRGLVLPPSGKMSDFVNDLVDSVGTHFPVGYLTDFISILMSSTSSSLPVINATIPAGVAGAGSTINLDLAHSLDFILYATTSSFVNSSASSTATFYDITSVYWNYIVYFSAIVYIVSRIFGKHVVGLAGHNFKNV